MKLKNLLILSAAFVAALFCPPAEAQSDIHYAAILTAASADCSTAGSCLSISATNYGVASVAVRGTYTGSVINFEFSDDGGVTWFTDTCTRSDSNNQDVKATLPSNGVRAWDCGVAASTNFRVRQSAIGTGSVSVGITITTASLEPAPTVAAPPIDGVKQTYSAAVTGFNVGTAATTDIAQIFGSATTTVRVIRTGISCTGANAAAFADVVLSVRSAAPTGGAATTATVVPYDSTDTAGAAVVKGWTTAPTAGAAVGTIAAAKLFIPTGTATLITPPLIFDFGNRPGRAVVLRGTAQGLVYTFNGATFATAGPTCDAWFEWTEE